MIGDSCNHMTVYPGGLEQVGLLGIGTFSYAPRCSSSSPLVDFLRFILRTSEMKEIEMRIHPNPSHSDYVSYIKRDVLFPQILPNDSIIVNVEIDVAVETITTTVEDMMSVCCDAFRVKLTLPTSSKDKILLHEVL